MTVKSQADLNTAFADNDTGLIHATDVRDLVDTIFSLDKATAAPPANATAPGVAGQFHIDGTNGKLYVCTATDTWVVADLTFAPVP